ncbi:MAG: glycosyltransferase family 8 protein [Pirellulaceae bacterium]|nr:glycosyltransferase family 8 protein [Pirellulaceae bacterium]
MSGACPMFEYSLDELAVAQPPAGWHTDAPTLLCATDDRYSMPLAAALASVMTHWDHRSSLGLQLVLLDGGISPENWERLSATVASFGVPTLRVQANRAAVEHLKISHHISHTAYFRLLSSRWLPDWISRVIYLDGDVIVLTNLRELWDASWDLAINESGETNEVWAVPDIACPYLDPRTACPEYAAFAPYFAALHPVRNFSELGLDAHGLYFNSGVMVLDLAAWRRENRSQQLLDCLQQNAAFIWCWDQYALNVIFGKRWGALPLAWNFGAHAYDYAAVPGLRGLSPLLKDQYQAMLERPKLIHFTTEIKPWHYYSFHPLTETFYEYLSLTPWKSWRPRKPGFKTWWHVQTFRWQKPLMALRRRLNLDWS